MYIGPWQEYKLAKLHKDAVQAIQTLTAQLPKIHAGGAEAGGLTTDNVASVLAHFQSAMAGGPPKPPRQPSRRGRRSGTARTSTSMPDINSHRRRHNDDHGRSTRSAASTPGGHMGRDDDHERNDNVFDDGARGGRRIPNSGGKSEKKKKKSKKKKGYVTRAMREVNRRRELCLLYTSPSPRDRG